MGEGSSLRRSSFHKNKRQKKKKGRGYSKGTTQLTHYNAATANVSSPLCTLFNFAISMGANSGLSSFNLLCLYPFILQSFSCFVPHFTNFGGTFPPVFFSYLRKRKRNEKSPVTQIRLSSLLNTLPAAPYPILASSHTSTNSIHIRARNVLKRSRTSSRKSRRCWAS